MISGSVSLNPITFYFLGAKTMSIKTDLTINGAKAINGESGKKLVAISETDDGQISLFIERGKSDRLFVLDIDTFPQTLAKMAVNTSTMVDAFVCKCVFAFVNIEKKHNEDGTDFVYLAPKESVLKVWFEGKIKPLIVIENGLLEQRKNSDLMEQKTITTNDKGDVRTVSVFKSSFELANMITDERRKAAKTADKLKKLESKTK